MSLSVWQSTIQDEAGNAVPAASVEVRNQDTLTLATVYDNAAGTGSPLSNPLTADADGFVRFYAAPGLYKIVATAGVETRTYENVLIGIDLTQATLPGFSVYGNTSSITASIEPVTASANNRVLSRVADVLAFTAVSYAMLDNASALSVLGRASNSSGVLADIQAGTDKQVLRRSGTVIGFGAVDLTSSDAVTGDLPFANVAQITGQAVLGVAAAGAADLAAISAGTDDRILRQTAGVLNFGQLTAGMFPATVIPDAALSSNVPLANANNVFTGALQQISSTTGNPEVSVTTSSALRSPRFHLTTSAGQYFLYMDAAGTALKFHDGAADRFVFTGDNTTTTLNGVAVSDFARLSQSNTFTQVQAISTGDTTASLSFVSPSGRFKIHAYHSSFSGSFLQIRNGADSADAPLQVNASALSFNTTLASFSINGTAASDFARLSQSNTFSKAGTLDTVWRTTDASSVRHLLYTNSTLRGIIGAAGATNSITTGDAVGDIVVRVESGKFCVSTDGGSTVHMSVGSGGALVTPYASASEVGRAGAPSRGITSSGNTAASDAGGTVKMTSGSGQTFTLDSDPPADSIVVLLNKSGSNWTIAASGTLTWATTGGTGSRTLPDKGMAVAFHEGSGNWTINGGGLF